MTVCCSRYKSPPSLPPPVPAIISMLPWPSWRKNTRVCTSPPSVIRASTSIWSSARCWKICCSAALLAVIVLMLFLRDFRPTIIVALSIPISLLLAVVLMHFTGVTLNIISLSGLALGVGMLVDNSIVVIENIYRLRQLGYNAAHRRRFTGCTPGGRGYHRLAPLPLSAYFCPSCSPAASTRQLFTDMGLTIAYSLMCQSAGRPYPGARPFGLQHDCAIPQGEKAPTGLLNAHDSGLRKPSAERAAAQGSRSAAARWHCWYCAARCWRSAWAPPLCRKWIAHRCRSPSNMPKERHPQLKHETMRDTGDGADPATVDGVETVGAMEGGRA